MLYTGDKSFWSQATMPDLTLEFEASILQILPSSSFLCFAVALILHYRQKPARIRRSTLLWAKVCVSFCLFLLEAVGLVLRCLFSDRTELTYPAAALDLVAALAIVAVVYVEHRHAIRTSALLGLYLAIGVLIDGTKTHSYFVRNMVASGNVAALAGAARLLLLVLEEVRKDGLLLDAEARSNSGGEVTSGFFTRTFFLYLFPMLNTGYRGVLSINDLGNLGPAMSSGHLFSRLSRYWPAHKQSKNRSLFTACCAAWKWALLLIVIPRLCVIGLTFSQPLVMYVVIGAVDEPSTSDEKSGGLVLATIFAFGGAAVCRAVTTHLKNRMLVRMRGALFSHISAKSYRLKLSQAKKQAAITLMSADFEGIVQGFPDLIEIPFSLLEAGLGMYFLGRFVKIVCLVIFIPLFITTVLAFIFARYMSPALRFWNQNIETRLAKTSRALSQLPAIKSLGLGPKISEYIQHLRTMSLGTAVMVDMVTPVIVIATALFLNTFGETLSAEIVYPILGVVSLVQDPLARLVKLYPSAMSMLGCFERIQEFLCQEEQVDQRLVGCIEPSLALSSLQSASEHIAGRPSTLLRFENASLAPPGAKDPVLSGVDFSILEGSITAMFGSTGSGKTTLANGLLGESDIVEGKLHIDETVKSIAVCGQQTWLSNVSFRDCIVGACEYEPAWFNLVLAYCKLVEDLENLPGGDLYPIGDGGAGLSGGQRQRIGIARAVYAVHFGTRVIVFDDIFSALDKKTALEILSGLCGNQGLLREKRCTVVLSSYLPECLYIADSLVLLDGNGRASYEACKPAGPVRLQVEELLRSGPAGHQNASASEDGKETHEKARRPAPTPNDGIQRAKEARQRGDAKLYLLWIDSIGRIILSLWMLLILVMSIAETFPPIYMRLWIELFPSNRLYLIGYALISASVGVLAAACLLWLFLSLAPRASNNLHKHLTDAVTRATLGFLSTTDSGSLLNRYSQDMELLSKRLPSAAYATFYCLFTTLVQMGAILAGATYMTAILPVVLFAIYLVQRYYLRTSRQLRLLDIESQAPLVAALKESSTGLVYIRSFACQQHCFARFLRLLDQSQRPFYFLLCSQALLALVLDLIAASVGTVLAILSLYVRNSSSQNAAGLAFLNLISLGTSFNRTVLRWTVMETSIGSLSRLRDFLISTPMETRKDTIDLPKNWPHTGRVELRNVVARYSVEKQHGQPSVLQGVSVQIQPGKKVGIMGRTGSGKSSLLYSLLGFLYYEGTIEVDGVDLSTAQPDELRSRIITISQDLVELDGTIRDNLFPYDKTWGKTTDAVVDEKVKAEAEKRDQIAQETLVRLGIWDPLPSKGGLDAVLDDVGYSHGDTQLFCIARAVVRRRWTGSKLILLDEATASVDTRRDQLVREIMAEYFQGCTIIVVAHRVETIADSNLTIHMANGKIDHVDNKDSR
ncbi:hypothetical protein NLG97_g5313 [Lecanicillium saksenae]|uniref:Uncharacterized protein n=1 Tax=Lecanicillium saksenae TaxID=468837 RepID=A0ACC1QSS6_9HYPO|nr:hypothetical protein NLG97_g5313 [Lecanicillium saksenae]